MNKFRFLLVLLIVALTFTFVACNRGGSARDSGEATEAELQEALEAIQQMLGSGTTAPPATAASTPAPSSSGSARGGDASWKWTAVADNVIRPVAIAYASGRFVAVGGNVIAYADW